ncbi:MFS transporter [Oryzicola mucosus]|uniref:MFS transporter n=1 Tax=Oryzicola mucosus TaxID=2767425 RepID=A0A8J6PJA9_9HYPH|nr:MFS transporter [Oryzicola mucosus]MBD0414591.1 MFS transporter [Oryzicola mucosus]
MAISATSGSRSRSMTREEKKVIFASSLGTVFEWYDFYLYGSLAAFIGTAFFSQYPEATRNIFALLAFAAGFLVRPFGALVFGRLGDLVGRKYTFLVTILIMGLSTFLVGLLPGSATIGILAPIILIILRMLQGLALGGEYGGAATYVAEHAPDDRRGYYTSWIQTTATLGLFLSLVVILVIQTWLGKETFAAWGWRVPFLLSAALLGISVWIRLSLNESPAFQRMKEEGKGSKAPLSEAFGQWKNARIALLALFGLTAGQAVVWYSGQFYALFFLQNVLKVDGVSVNIMIAIALALGTGFFVFFGWLSDKIGRKPIIMAGLALAIVTYFPLFKALTWAANPALAQAQQDIRATVTAAPGDCTFQFNPVGTAKFTTSCDIATGFLARNSVPYDVVTTAAPGTPATVTVGSETVASFDAIQAGADAAAQTTAFNNAVHKSLHDAGYPLVLNEATGTYAMVADPAQVSWPKVIGVLFILVLYVTMVYGPIAAILVEMFPTRIRYTGMSLPYHIGNGWFGGLLPATVFAMSAARGDIYYGLWYPIAIAAMTLIIGMIFIKDTLGTDLSDRD